MLPCARAAPLLPAKETALSFIDRCEESIVGLDDRIWEYAEPSLAEWNSAPRRRPPARLHPHDRASSLIHNDIIAARKRLGIALRAEIG